MDDRARGATPVPVVFLAHPPHHPPTGPPAGWPPAFSLEPPFMPHRHLSAAALALGLLLVAPTLLAAQTADSASAPHIMAAVVVNGSHRPSARENARLKRELSRYDERIATLELHLDSLKTYADSLDRDRVYFEAAAAHARARRTAMEQRLRDLEARTARSSDTPISTP